MAAKASPLTNMVQTTARLCVLLAVSACMTAPLCAGQERQERHEQQQEQQTPAPPPLRYIPREEQAQLSNIKSPGDRTRANIEMAAGHLRRAREATEGGLYDDAAAEMGTYQALFEDALRYLGRMDSNSGKVRDLYKRLELALREDVPRIETIRRITPAEYAVHIKAILEYSKEARAKALESFYGNTVLRQPRPGEAGAFDNKSRNPADHSSSPPGKQP